MRKDVSDLNAEKLYKSSEKSGCDVSRLGKMKFLKTWYYGNQYIVFAFPKKQFVAEKQTYKIHLIRLGKYVLTLPIDSPEEEGKIDFAKLTLYNTETGTADKTPQEICGSQIIILNKMIMAVWEEKGDLPRFFTVVADKLTEIPVAAVENILCFGNLLPRYRQALIRQYPQKGWEVHNDILINPQTLDVPSKLHFAFWRIKRHNKAELTKVNETWLANVLARREDVKSPIRYITF